MSVAWLFPGQGSQSVGMMAAYGESAVIRDTFAEASEALGEDLWAMVCDGPAERLALTVNTQLVILVAGVANLQGNAYLNMTEGHIFHVITWGRNLMQPHGSQISPEDRWKIAKYVKVLQKKK